MKIIPLTQGKETVVDDDCEYLSKYAWYAAYKESAGYYRVVRNSLASEGKPRTIYLARVIMDAPDGMVVDHINGNTLDNRRENLRVVSTRLNSQNCKSHRAGRLVAGVHKDNTRKLSRPYRSRIYVNGCTHELGYYVTESDASRVYGLAVWLFDKSESKQEILA